MTTVTVRCQPSLQPSRNPPKPNPIFHNEKCCWRTLECIFLKAGFRFVRQEGSHRSYLKDAVLRPVVIPACREVPVFIRNNLKTAGLSRDDYFRLLDQCR